MIGIPLGELFANCIAPWKVVYLYTYVHYYQYQELMQLQKMFLKVHGVKINSRNIHNDYIVV